jgi:NADPH:quinone reductase-like Zn-dependent oxidoreductase/acyl carrier protein
MGSISGSFALRAIAERALLVPIPGGWSFEQAAAVPTVFMTAHYGLIEQAALKRGEKVLIHAGAGGVGMAAIQIARHLGAEVYATASSAKWEALRELGVEADHIASSRDLAFKEKFLAETNGEGMDVILNSLAGEFVDASLELLAKGGRFVEMGKTDIREPAQVGAEHPGATYLAFDLVALGAEAMRELLDRVLELFQNGALDHPPIASWDVRRAREAFRHLREGKNVGKVVLSIPRPIDPERTVLISGATGALGALVAKHLVEVHGARRLLLLSRRGAKADGAKELKAELEERGAKVKLAACDVSDRAQLAAQLEKLPKKHPLGAVVHAAGAIEDGTIESLGPEQLQRVFAAKADAAWHLHELSAGIDLSAFVMFSSATGILGGPGQANYAAASVFLDALAARRQAEGLAATAIAWGLWSRQSGMTAGLSEADLARMERSGFGALSDRQGLALFDASLAAGRELALALRLIPSALRARASAGVLPSMLAGLVRLPKGRDALSASAPSLREQLAALPAAQHERAVLDLVRAEVAAVLGHSSPASVDAQSDFKSLGFDSLAAVELRNRLGAATGLRLPATLIFDHPTALELAAFLLAEAGVATPGEAGGNGAVELELDRLEGMLAEVESVDQRERAAARLRALLAGLGGEDDEVVAEASDDEIFELLDRELGRK